MILDSTKKITEASTLDHSTPNYAEALRMLKNTDALLEKRKKQIKVQAIKAQKGNWMEEEQAKKKKIREEAKAETERAISAFQEMKQKQMLKIKELRQRGEKSRRENTMNRSKSRMEAFEHKLRVKEEIRMKSREHQQRIKEFKKEVADKKKSRCLELYQELKSSRMHINSLQQSHASQIRRSVSRQRDELMQKLRRKKSQLQKLSQPEVGPPAEPGLSSTPIQKSMDKESAMAKAKTRETLPYRRTSAYMKSRGNRNRSISQARFDSSSKTIVYS